MAPRAFVTRDLAFPVDVDVLAEVEHAAGFAADREEVPRHLDQLAVLGLALLDDARVDAADSLHLVEHRDDEAGGPSLEGQRMPGIEDPVGGAPRRRESALGEREISGEL